MCDEGGAGGKGGPGGNGGVSAEQVVGGLEDPSMLDICLWAIVLVDADAPPQRHGRAEHDSNGNQECGAGDGGGRGEGGGLSEESVQQRLVQAVLQDTVRGSCCSVLQCGVVGCSWLQEDVSAVIQRD